MDELERQLLDLAMEQRDKRISISGIKDSGNETPKKTVVRTVRYDNPTPAQAANHKTFISEDDIDIAYRTGRKIGKIPQNIVVHLKWSQVKLRIMGLKKKLLENKQTKHFISDDIPFPFEVPGLRQKLKNICEAAKKQNIDSRVVRNKLILNGKSFTSADLEGLPDDLIDESAKSRRCMVA